MNEPPQIVMPSLTRCDVDTVLRDDDTDAHKTLEPIPFEVCDVVDHV